MIMLFRSNLMLVNSLIMAIASLPVFVRASSSALVEDVVTVCYFTNLQATGPP